VKFLLGMTFGILCAVGVMMFPEAREAVLVELDSQTQEFSEIARMKSLESIKSSFLDETVYTDIAAEAETGPDIEQALWADQIVVAESLPLTEPADVSATPSPESEPAVSVIDVNPINPVFHAVWSPFRSERSATGFASTLSSRLNREFRVVRLAAGRYEVGIDYSSDQELLNVLASVLQFTSAGASSLQVSL